LSICQNASAQYPGQVYATRMPNTFFTSAEKNEAATTTTTNTNLGGGYYGDTGYGFGSNSCGCSNGCCDGVWGGYTPSCGIFGHHGRHGCGCNSGGGC